MPSWSSGVAPGAGTQVAVVEVLPREVNEDTAHEIQDSYQGHEGHERA